MKPSPWILFMGGGALIQVAVMVGGSSAPAWARYTGMALLAGLGVFCAGAALHQVFKKKPERPKFQSKHKQPPP